MRKKVVKAPKKKFSWTAEVLAIEVGGEPLRIEIDDRKKVAPLLSREIKLKAPDRVFETDTVTEPGYCLIKRTA